MKVTIRSVAQHAGVATSTVSHYLNGTAPIAATTAARIERAIRTLNYRVDLGARSLRQQRTNTVGVLLPTIANPFFSEIANVMEYSLWEKGYQTLLCISDNDPNRETLHFTNLLNRRVDGVLMIYCSEESAIDALMQTVNVPVVFADRLVTGHPSVAGDGFIGGQLAAQHLLELGHRRIGVLAGDAMIRNVGQRVAGFRQDFEAGGGQLVMVLEGHQSLDLGLRVEDVLGNQKRADRVTAVFATNDIVAIGAWRRLLELGYKIPEDISLIGFDDISMSRLLVPPLTTVAQNLSQIAREAAALLIELIGHRRSNRLNGAPGESINRLIAPTLIVRGSTGGVSVSGL